MERVSFDKRVKHGANDQELELANKIFEALSVGDSVSFPVNLENQGYKPFGDGQSNGQANFKSWTLKEPPLIGILNKGSGTLSIRFHHTISNSLNKIRIRFPNGSVKDYQVDSEKRAEVSVNIEELGWSSLGEGKTVYVKPSHWNDWFALKFQFQYVGTNHLAHSVPQNFWRGVLPNPLKLDANLSMPPLLQLQAKAKGAQYQVFSNDKVHAIYPNPNASNKVHKSSGGNWTFLLDPTIWSGPSRSTFKQLYSCFEGRAYWEESVKKSVSGTSWHHVGDPGEIILNSVKNESRSLVTAIGEQVTAPTGIKLAYGLSHVGFSSLVKPGQAFVSIKGQYHWHPVHTVDPICVEVWTPDCQPSSANGYGFRCP